MDPRDFSFELWLIIIIIIDSFRISSAFNIFTLTTYLAIGVFLKMYPYGKKSNNLRDMCIQVSETKSIKNISTQTSNYTVTTGIQTIELPKEEKLEKQIQTDKIFRKNVSIQTIYQVPTLKIEKEIQTDSLHFKSRGIQAMIDTHDKQTQAVVKNTISVASQTESLLPTSYNSYKEDQKIDKIIIQDLKEEEETHGLINNSFRNDFQNINGEEDTYFNLSSLTVLSSSSIQNRKEKKKNGWRRFRKAIKRITHPFKSYKK